MNASRTCAAPACEVVFEPYRPSHRFCSAECRRAGWEADKWREREEAVVRRVLPRLERVLREELRRANGS